jgi:hypothetical protein
VTDDNYEEKLEREIRQRVDNELAKARQEIRRHREEVERERAEARRAGERAEARRARDESKRDHGSMPTSIPLPDVEKVSGLLGIVADKIPELLGGLRDVLYSPAAAENMAEAVAKFYKKLTEAGIPEDQALDMARGYMINLRDVLGKKGLDLGSIARADEEE